VALDALIARTMLLAALSKQDSARHRDERWADIWPNWSEAI
jgi:hypothetical protein